MMQFLIGLPYVAPRFPETERKLSTAPRAQRMPKNISHSASSPL